MPYLSASEVIIHKEALSSVLTFYIPLPCGKFSGVIAQLNPGRGTDIDDHLFISRHMYTFYVELSILHDVDPTMFGNLCYGIDG